MCNQPAGLKLHREWASAIAAVLQRGLRWYGVLLHAAATALRMRNVMWVPKLLACGGITSILHVSADAMLLALLPVIAGARVSNLCFINSVLSG